MSLDNITVFLITASTNISVLLLLALGLAIVYGVRGIINLAHGEFVMLGAYIALRLNAHQIPFVLAVPLGAVAVGTLGLVVERLLIRRLYDRLTDCMLATWGLSLILVQLVVLQYGTTTTGLPFPLGSVGIGRYSVATYDLVIIALAAAALAAIFLLMRRTSFGLLARATARSTGMAEALGVDTARIDMFTFAAGSAAAGFAGALLSPFLGVSPTMGQNFIAKAFMTVLVGGADYVLGTVGAASLLGGFEAALAHWLAPVIGQVGLLLLAIVIVRFRPNGLTQAAVRR
jgi:branched-chain amino acid transport system permease protein